MLLIVALFFCTSLVFSNDFFSSEMLRILLLEHFNLFFVSYLKKNGIVNLVAKFIDI